MARKVGDKPGGASEEAHLKYLASKGHPVALAALQGPEIPVELDYLYDWLNQLHGRSGVTAMVGINSLTYGTIADWSRLSGIVPNALEIEALMVLDNVKLYPDETEDDG